ncbi:glycerol-3-phosphate transporter, partial [Marimonas sp. MJW-29]
MYYIFLQNWLAYVASTVDQSEIVRPPMPLWPGDQLFENYRKALVSVVNETDAMMMLNSKLKAMGLGIGLLV